MTTPTPTIEPGTVVAGDTVAWKRCLPDYPAGTYALKYRLVNAAGKIDITATASGTDHLVSVASSTTTSWTAGAYLWTAWVEKTGERFTIGSGTITVRPNIAALNTYDGRTDARKILDSLNAAYQTYVSTNGHVSEYEVAGRRVKYKSAEEILRQINFWETRVAAEERAERIAKGLGGGNKLLVRFNK